MKRKDHKTIRQTKQQPFTTTYCVQPRCKFNGKEAVSGTCFNNEGETIPWDNLDEHEKELVADLKRWRKREGKNYVRSLEAHYITAMMNWQISLDETLRLRRDMMLMKRPRR